MTKKKSVAKKPTYHIPVIVVGVVLCSAIIGGSLGLLALKSWHRLPGTASTMAVNPDRVTKAPGTIANRLFEVKVDNIQESTTGDMAFKPEPGYKFLAVEVSITNKTSQIMQFFPSTQTYIRDPEGELNIMRPMILKNPLPAGDIAPGQTVIGQLSYQISSRLRRGKLYIDAGWFGTQPQVFDLGN